MGHAILQVPAKTPPRSKSCHDFCFAKVATQPHLLVRSVISTCLNRGMNSLFHRLKSLETIDHASMYPEENGAVKNSEDR